MGLRDWFGGLIGRKKTSDEYPLPDEGDEADAAPAASDHRPSGAGGGAPSSGASRDPLKALRGVPSAVAVPRALEQLEAAPAAAEAAQLVSWLRDAARDPAVAPELRVRVADLFVARGEADVAEAVLRPLLDRGDVATLPALVRLADLAVGRGAVEETTRLYEEILAIDVSYPGVRERVARMAAPARAGAAGATLLAPDAARLAQGRLELLRELGRGAAGAVFLARDKELAREVALKIYHPAQRADRGARLKSEVQVAASLASRHVVRVYDLFEALGALSMEHAAGGALRAQITRGEASLAQRWAWLRGVAHALAVAHDRGWVHRDLKPGNVLLRVDREVVLTDFGLARRAGATIEPHEGTPGYVAPEVRQRLVADPRIDVYAFGALARELVGERDPVLAPLVAASLSTDPDARPRDGAALVRALESAAAG